MGQFYTIPGLAFIFDAMPPAEVIPTYGGVVISTPTFTDTTNPSPLLPGMVLYGDGIPPGTTVLTVVGATVTMSADATATIAAEPVTGVLPAELETNLTLHLLTGPIAQLPQTVWGDLTEANYNGYAPVDILAWQAVASDQSDYSALSAACQNFVPTDYLVPNTITGLAWTYPGAGLAGPVLVATEQFASPVVLAFPGSTVPVTPILSLPYDVTAGPSSPLLFA